MSSVMIRRILLTLLTVGFCLYGISFGHDYIVGEGDVLKVTVYDHDDLTTTARVGGDGTIAFPLVGEVKVGGLTLPQISGTLASLLADGYVIDPQVSIFVKEFRSKKAFIMGEVQKPGFHVLSGNTT